MKLSIPPTIPAIKLTTKVSLNFPVIFYNKLPKCMNF